MVIRQGTVGKKSPEKQIQIQVSLPPLFFENSDKPTPHLLSKHLFILRIYKKISDDMFGTFLLPVPKK